MNKLLKYLALSLYLLANTIVGKDAKAQNYKFTDLVDVKTQTSYEVVTNKAFEGGLKLSLGKSHSRNETYASLELHTLVKIGAKKLNGNISLDAGAYYKLAQNFNTTGNYKPTMQELGLAGRGRFAFAKSRGELYGLYHKNMLSHTPLQTVEVGIRFFLDQRSGKFSHAAHLSQQFTQ